jgi:hypothetical protein
MSEAGGVPFWKPLPLFAGAPLAGPAEKGAFISMVTEKLSAKMFAKG